MVKAPRASEIEAVAEVVGRQTRLSTLGSGRRDGFVRPTRISATYG